MLGMLPYDRGRRPPSARRLTSRSKMCPEKVKDYDVGQDHLCLTNCSAISARAAAEKRRPGPVVCLFVAYLSSRPETHLFSCAKRTFDVSRFPGLCQLHDIARNRLYLKYVLFASSRKFTGSGAQALARVGLKQSDCEQVKCGKVARVGPIRLKLAELEPESAGLAGQSSKSKNNGTKSHGFARNRARVGQSWPSLPEVAQEWPNFDETWSKSSQSWPKSPKDWPTSSQNASPSPNSTDVGQLSDRHRS